MNFYLYARPHRQQNGKLAQEKIALNAHHPSEYYAPYNYFPLHCGVKPKALAPNWDSSPAAYTEYLIRARRCMAFSDTTGLKPVKTSQRKHSALLNRLQNACNLDHTTCWVSAIGTTFVLTEPYAALEDHPNDLAKAGFYYIELPEALSPYCGGWNPSAGAKPRTKSYLICSAAHRAELLEIEDDLFVKASFMPRWNDLARVSYV